MLHLRKGNGFRVHPPYSPCAPPIHPWYIQITSLVLYQYTHNTLQSHYHYSKLSIHSGIGTVVDGKGPVLVGAGEEYYIGHAVPGQPRSSNRLISSSAREGSNR